MRQDCDILSHQLCVQQGGGTSTHLVSREEEPPHTWSAGRRNLHTRGQQGGGTSTHVVSREEDPPHTSHHGVIEISFCKNKEYKKEKIFYMDVLKTIHKKISNQKRERERENERERE